MPTRRCCPYSSFYRLKGKVQTAAELNFVTTKRAHVLRHGALATPPINCSRMLLGLAWLRWLGKDGREYKRQGADTA